MPLPLPLPAPTTPLLRPWQEQDAAVLLAAGHDPLISRYRYSLLRAPKAAQQWVALTETDRDRGTRLELAVQESGMPLGRSP
jgi:hypothetical protein